MIFATYDCVSAYGGIPLYCCTAPEPALYAASAFGIEPNWRIRLDISFACALIDATGSKGSDKPSERAVPGMN